MPEAFLRLPSCRRPVIGAASLIDRIDARMRQGYTSWEGERFRESLRRLKEQHIAGRMTARWRAGLSSERVRPRGRTTESSSLTRSPVPVFGAPAAYSGMLARRMLAEWLAI